MKPVPANDALNYELALGEGDQYAALLAARLNGVGVECADETYFELVVEEPGF